MSRTVEAHVIVLLVVLLSLPTVAAATVGTVSATAGAVLSGFAGTDYPETETRSGSHLAVGVTARRGAWGVRTGVELEQRGGSWMEGGEGDVWELTCVSIPLLLAYRWHARGLSPDVSAGIAGSWIATSSYERKGDGSWIPDFLHDFDVRAATVLGVSFGTSTVRPRIEFRADRSLRSLRAASYVLDDRTYPEKVFGWSVGVAGGIEVPL